MDGAFRGSYKHTIDSKGRVSLPARFREILHERGEMNFILTNFDLCLVAYPYDEWIKIEERIGSMSMMKKEVQSFQRFFLSGVVESQIDSQGRILIPSSLREHAKLEKDLVFVGLIRKIEIWNGERFAEDLNRTKENFENIRQALEDLGL